MAQDSGAIGALSAQLKYLTDAAHLMAFKAPGCSSHLMSRCDQIMFSSHIDQSSTHRRHICGGCGNIMTPGWTSTTRKEEERRQLKRHHAHKRREKGVTKATENSMVYTCDRCGRETRYAINRASLPRIIPRRGLQPCLTPGEAPERLSTTAPAQTGTPTLLSANANSKKRAKSRKQGGLQALLAKNKEASQSSSGGFGLDLFDLMKQG